MTQSKVRFASFEEYLTWSDSPENYLERRYELIDGELCDLPPESGLNDWIALNLRDLLIHIINRQLIRLGKCELQVPVLQPKDAANRYPDLVVMREEHIELTQRRLTITRTMPPPQLIAEVVSPGRTNRDRDIINKRAQYAAIGVAEYWLIDPSTQTVTVLELQGDDYNEVGTYQGSKPITSPTFPALTLKTEQVFQS